MTIQIDMGSDALNEAAWKLLDKIQEYQQVDAPLFNNLKGCLKEAIESYLTQTFECTKRN
jgi:hypothetical protein